MPRVEGASLLVYHTVELSRTGTNPRCRDSGARHVRGMERKDRDSTHYSRRHSFSIEEFRNEFVNIFLMFENNQGNLGVMTSPPGHDSMDVSQGGGTDPAAESTPKPHQPIIRGSSRIADSATEDGREGVRKNPLLRVFSSHSGLGNRLQMGSLQGRSDVTQEADSQQCLAPMTYSAQRHVRRERLSRLSSQPVLSSSNTTQQSKDVQTKRVPGSETHSSLHRPLSACATDLESSVPVDRRVVSTASIRLKRQPNESIRKRSASEERRRISVIRTAASLPDMARPSPMLDAWLSSLVKQRKDTQVEDMDCSEEPLIDRQLYSKSGVWPSPDTSCHCSGLAQRRKSHDCVHSVSHKQCSTCERRYLLDPSHGAMLDHVRDQGSSLPGADHIPESGISIHVTDDEDSACVQSISDSASVQLCVPSHEDMPSSPRQHLPLSPCSSVGSGASFHSARSSMADSAVDLTDDTLEIEFYSPSQSPVPGVHTVHLKQQLFAQSKLSSSSSSSCQTVVETQDRPVTSTITHVWPKIHSLPSFVISDHSDEQEPSEVTSLDIAALFHPSRSASATSLDVCSSSRTGFSRSSSAASMSSESSLCSSPWTDSSASDAELSSFTTEQPRRKKQSSWKKIRSIIRWSPFIQVFKKHRYPWIQLAGHQGNFQAGDAGSVLKKLDSREHQCFQRLMHDRLQPFVPEYRGVVEKSGERYVQLQDLLCEFTSPCVMDIKMGVRTYLEEELEKARKKPTLRKDMYQKMVDVDMNAPTQEEHSQRAVTKPRYMQWRDEMSSSVDLGFRIEGIKKSDGASSKDFKKTKSRESVAEVLKSFFGDSEIVLSKYLQRLREIQATQESSVFFQSHEVIGSSLLFVHDTQGNVNVWMIDFGKTEPLPKAVTVDHRSAWVEGNHEDGYLFGLDNIISILEELQASSVA